MSNPEIILTRANCCKLLAACFYEPDTALLIEEKVCENLIRLLQILSPEALAAAHELKNAMESNNQQQLSIDHASLFVGPFELLAPPYGSIYLEHQRQVQGKSTVDIQRYYQEAGLKVNIHEPADHIAIELEFMYYLMVQETDALVANDRDKATELHNTQARFFSSAMTWIPEFCTLLRAGATTTFYTALADCIEIFHISCSRYYTTGIDQTALAPCP